MRKAQFFRSEIHRVSWTIAVCLSLILVATASAQLPTATILGVVKDSTGAVVPDAQVTVRNLDTGQTRMTVTSGDGAYRVPALRVGNHEARVEHPGFQAEVRSGLTLTVSQEAVVNFTLQVGAMEQTVSVTAEAPLVNTTTGSLGGLVDARKISDLPLNGRNYVDLTLLQTGVTLHKSRNTNISATAGSWFSSNGAPVRSNNYLLDGASMVNLFGAGSGSISGSTLGVEGIQEYRVVTNFFGAEYGMTMGSQMLIVSKGGTNNFHGSLFEYLRNSALDARNFFDRKTIAQTRRLPSFTRNNFGGSVGGPIKKDKTFFFGVYEGLRERLGVTTVDNVPAAGCHGPAGATITNTACPQLGSVSSVTIAPVMAPLLTLYPEPNLPNNQFTFPFSQPTRQDWGQMRVDQYFSTQDTMFGRYTVDDAERIITGGYPQFKTIGASRNQFATLSETHVFSPTLLNTFRFSFSRTNFPNESPSGISGPQFSFVSGREIGGISIGGVTTLGPDGTTPSVFKQNIFTWSDDLVYTRGRHSLKFGTLINRYQHFSVVSSNSRGGLNFANLAGFLQGRANTYNALTPGSITDRTYHHTTLGFYAQDDLRVSSRLTLNLGLRYEFITQPQEVRGRGAALRDVQHDADTTLGPPFINPSLKNFSPRFGFAWDVKGDGKTAVRGGFGLLYDIGNLSASLMIASLATPPFSSLSIVANPPPLTSLPLSFPPEAVGKSLRTADYHFPQPHLLQYNLTVERQLPWNTAVTLAYGGSRGVNITRRVEGNPFVPLGVGQNGVCVPAPASVVQDINRPNYCWLGNDPRTNPNWQTIEFQTGGGNSWYNSLQFGVTKRLSNGLQFQSSYTWSKVIDETQAQLGSEDISASVFGSDPTHRNVDRAPSVFDITHNWRLNAIYQLPGLASDGGILGKAFNGWWLSGILSLQTGYPFTPALNSNRSRSGVLGIQGGGGVIDRPDLVAGRSNDNIVSGTTAGCLGVAPGQQLGTPNLYLDPCAFTIPAAGFLGTAGRSILRAPGLANLDFSLVKDTPFKYLGEGGKLEFRAEFFNILNRVNFALPNRLVFAARQDVETPLANVGRITSADTSRQIQFALKLIF